jgi:hypothetical protein
VELVNDRLKLQQGHWEVADPADPAERTSDVPEVV